MVTWITYEEYDEDREDPIISFTNKWFILSNDYKSKIVYSGYTYPTCTHAYLAAQTLNKQDRKRIRKAKTTKEARQIAKKSVIRPNWDKMKLKIMEKLLRKKFARNTPNINILLKTRKREIIMNNTYGDRYWGVYKGEGKNHLGKILMTIRADNQPLWYPE